MYLVEILTMGCWDFVKGDVLCERLMKSVYLCVPLSLLHSKLL